MRYSESDPLKKQTFQNVAVQKNVKKDYPNLKEVRKEGLEKHLIPYLKSK